MSVSELAQDVDAMRAAKRVERLLHTNARKAVHVAVQDGALVRPSKCSRCPNPVSAPLSVEGGPELDALIDERVFGYRWFPVTSRDPAPKTCTHRLARPTLDGFYGHIRAEKHADGRVVVFGGRDYSTDVAAAWLVMEKLIADGWRVEVDMEPSAGPAQCACATVSRGERCEEFIPKCATTFPLAICRVALAAAGPTP